MPVIINIHHYEYDEFCLQGKKLPENILCPKCVSEGVLFFDSRTAKRNLIFEDKGPCIITIRLAKCEICGSRTRVLPCEALPYKVYSLTLIVTAIETYQHPVNSLRATVEAFQPNQCHIAHATLWFWIKGLGERMADHDNLHERARRLNLAALPSLCHILKKTPCSHINVSEQWLKPLDVPCHKFKSEERHNTLFFAFKFVEVASLLFPQQTYPVIEWQNTTAPLLNNVALWMFFTHPAETTFEHAFFDSPQVESAPFAEDDNERIEEIHDGKKGPKTKNRSPPGSVLATTTDRTLAQSQDKGR